jgi:hypothetical protein
MTIKLQGKKASDEMAMGAVRALCKFSLLVSQKITQIYRSKQ